MKSGPKSGIRKRTISQTGDLVFPGRQSDTGDRTNVRSAISGLNILFSAGNYMGPPRARQLSMRVNPSGRGQLAVFPRCSLEPYEFRYGRLARALKNSQLAPAKAMLFMGQDTSRLLKNEATNSSEAVSQDSLGRSPRNPTKTKF
jgi:hypothetical protein